MGVELRADPERCRPTRGLIGMLARAEARSREGEEPEPSDGEAPELEDLPDAVADDPAGTYDEVTAQEELEEARVAAPECARRRNARGAGCSAQGVLCCDGRCLRSCAENLSELLIRL